MPVHRQCAEEHLRLSNEMIKRREEAIARIEKRSGNSPVGALGHSKENLYVRMHLNSARCSELLWVRFTADTGDLVEATTGTYHRMYEEDRVARNSTAEWFVPAKYQAEWDSLMEENERLAERIRMISQESERKSGCKVKTDMSNFE